MEQPTTFEDLAPRKRSGFPFVIIILIILAAIFGWWLLSGRNKLGLTTGGTSSDYQAVFLSNNQVYFGKLSKSNDDYVLLTDIFYLQVGQPLQPSQPNPNVSLIKLGSELHGPIDQMKINRDHILFIENLRADSQVVQGIEKFKTDQKVAP